MTDNRPPDVRTMRATTDELLTGDASLPRHDHLEDMTLRLRGQLSLIIPVVQDLARTLPDDNATRSLTLDTVDNARIRLNASPDPGLVSATKYGKSLARELRTLCDLYEALTRTPAEPPV